MTTQLLDTTLELRDRLPAMGVSLPFAMKRRDPKEPGRRRKEKTEDALYRAFMQHFRQQRKYIKDTLQRIAPERKSMFGYDADYYMSQFGDDFWDNPDFIAKLGLILTAAAANGLDIFQDMINLEIDYTLVNAEAAEWATKYAGNLITSINKTTKEAVRGIISDFVSTPGMTIGDIVTRLPYNEPRALMIAVTETTKTYAMAERMAGEALQKEYPDVLVVKRWYTNNDDRVCPLCGPLHMAEVPLKEAFPGGYEQPPAHVRCRCWMSTTTTLGET